MSTAGHTTTMPAGLVSLDRVLDLAVAVGVVLLVVIGFLTSYETLRGLAVSDGGFPPWLAPTVPLSFDLGIVVLSLKVLANARHGRQSLMLRLLVAALSVSSVAVNSTASTGVAGRLLHAIPPAMFVICFESAVASARRNTPRSRRSGWSTTAMWLLAPVSAFTRWRRRILATSEPSLPQRRPTVRRPSSPTATPTRAESSATPSRVSGASRLDCARAAIERTPTMSAPQLRQHLDSHGHQVSVRTAQRLKAALGAARSSGPN
jgi:hypothetical protein